MLGDGHVLVHDAARLEDDVASDDAAFEPQSEDDCAHAVGQLPGPELSIAKLASTSLMSEMGDFVSHVLGPRLIADTGEWGTYAWGQLVLGTPGMRIAGGTDEVMRNIVGERVLGLPKAR